MSKKKSTGPIPRGTKRGVELKTPAASYLAVVADTAVRRGQHLRCRRSQVAGAHDTGLGHSEAED